MPAGFTRFFREELAHVDDKQQLLPSGRHRRSAAHRGHLSHPRGDERSGALRGASGHQHPGRGQDGLHAVQGLRSRRRSHGAAGASLRASADLRGPPQGFAGHAPGPERDGHAERQLRAATRHPPAFGQEGLLPERFPARLSHRGRVGQRAAEGGPPGDRDLPAGLWPPIWSGCCTTWSSIPGCCPARGSYVVYLKGRDEVAGLLALAGAHEAALHGGGAGGGEGGALARESCLPTAMRPICAAPATAASRQLEAIAPLERSGRLARRCHGRCARWRSCG